MKTILNFKKILLIVIASLAIVSCENEDYLVFTTQTQDSVIFQNDFQPLYKVSAAISTNIAERLVWNEPDFNVPSTVTYVVDFSNKSDFSSVVLSSGDTSNKHYGLTVASILEIAASLNLDEDPLTSNPDGTPNNLGTIFAKVTAYVGSSSNGANQVTIESPISQINFELIEAAESCIPSELSTWGLVGSAVNDWGGTSRGFSSGNDVPFFSYGQDGLFRAAITFLDGEFKIRQDNDWGINYGDTGADGVLDNGGDNILITAGTYYVDFDFNKMEISLTEPDSTWGIVGSATINGWGDGPDVKMIPDPCNEGVYIIYDVVLTDGEMKFRADDDWGVNLGDTGADGITDQGGDNIAVSAGIYNITLDTVNNTYSIEIQ